MADNQINNYLKMILIQFIAITDQQFNNYARMALIQSFTITDN